MTFYDTDWNPAMDRQAQERCHRIGFDLPVHIYRLVTKDTIEESIYIKAMQNQKLDDMILEDGDFAVEQLDNKQLEEAYQMFEETEDY